MKCYLLMNTVSQRNSTFSVKTYENWCLHDDNLCRTCVKVTELSKGALGKINNTSKNDRRGRPSLLNLFCCSVKPNSSDWNTFLRNTIDKKILSRRQSSLQQRGEKLNYDMLTLLFNTKFFILEVYLGLLQC